MPVCVDWFKRYTISNGAIGKVIIVVHGSVIIIYACVPTFNLIIRARVKNLNHS
jgi:hypothetical protein